MVVVVGVVVAVLAVAAVSSSRSSRKGMSGTILGLCEFSDEEGFVAEQFGTSGAERDHRH